MTTVHVGVPALHRIRAVVSPLWETVSSLRVVLATQSRAAYWPYDSWLARASKALATPALAEVVTLLRTAPQRLTPLPLEPSPTIESELATLVDVPESCLEAVEAYWRYAVAPYWLAMRSVHDEETRRLGQILLTAGPDALLDALPGGIRWRRPILTVVDQLDSVSLRCSQELMVVPLLFAQDRAIHAGDGASFAFSYLAPGASLFSTSSVSESPNPQRGDGLALLLGRARAGVLRALATAPTTTSALAQRLSLSASTVSEHLSTLVAAGVVQRRREGVRVLYELHRSGAALLACIDELN